MERERLCPAIEPPGAMAEEQLALLDLEGWEQILDVGAATARSQRRSSSTSHGVSMMGVDPSQGMIAFASGHFGPYDRPLSL